MNSHCKIEIIQTEIDHVGVDVSKLHLDVSIAGNKNLRLTNTSAGLRKIHQKLAKLTRPRVTCGTLSPNILNVGLHEGS